MQNEVPVLENNSAARDIIKPKSWLIKIDYINHLVLFNKAVIALLAEEGAGKTTFIDILKNCLDATIKSHVLSASTPFDEAQFLDELNTIFHCKASKKGLPNFIKQINERKAHVLVILDKAEALPDTFLAKLVDEIKKYDECYFHICLVADFSLVASLNKVDANLVHSIELGSLSEAEMKTYLLNFLPNPIRLDKTMTPARLEQFYRLTGGSIARINREMVDYFSPNTLKPKAKSKSYLREIGLIGTAAFVLMASSYIWHEKTMQALPRIQEKQQLVQEVREIVLPLQEKLIAYDEALISELPKIHEELMAKASHISAWNLGEKLAVQPSPKLVDVKLKEDANATLVVRDRVVVIPKSLTDTKPKPKLVIKKPDNLPKANGQFTIQLLASRREDDIKRFIKTYNIKQQAKIRFIKRDDIIWYVLTLGDYDKRQLASNAIKTLPAELARFKPWVRPRAQLRDRG